MSSHPLLRLVVGVTVGFFGAFATIAMIDWLEVDRPTGFEPTEVVVGRPDFDRFCDSLGLDAAQIGGEDDRWRCVGRVNGLWTHQELSVDEVCRQQYAAGASRSDGRPVEWTCVAAL